MFANASGSPGQFCETMRHKPISDDQAQRNQRPAANTESAFLFKWNTANRVTRFISLTRDTAHLRSSPLSLKNGT
jgi:hypothetical protein